MSIAKNMLKVLTIKWRSLTSVREIIFRILGTRTERPIAIGHFVKLFMLNSYHIMSDASVLSMRARICCMCVCVFFNLYFLVFLDNIFIAKEVNVEASYRLCLF